ncbi:serine hydrolase domain-containing protein [Portibacter lacus]|uniref:Beta-lactamase-related domain-containing protein n=1 Tax=Portibacter lacus TaxID=1099794 RepID=A0AA37WF50_9BACT|nr:serine hydrolase domain-containing protein [Portibacter lacus]GLR19526.1 hypothetical protein GCM10007940_41420 [Portibacter lacus]
MKVLPLFILSLIIVLNLSCGVNMQKMKVQDQNIKSIVDQYYQDGSFNGSVLVVQKNKVIFNQSYGFADAAKQELLTNDFKYGIGSIYKEFPAVLIMQLSEKKLLNLNDNINKYLPELPEWSSKIKITHLLQYTSGLPRIDFNKYFSKNIEVTEADIMKDILSLEKLEFEPGSDYLYTNNCPFLLIKIIEKFTNRDFVDYIQNQLFTPLDLSHIEIKKQYPYTDNTKMAIPFNREFKIDQYKINAPTLLFTATTMDLFKWIYKLNSFEIISSESLLFLSQTADLNNDNMQAPFGNCKVEKEVISHHAHHGSMGNYEGFIQWFSKEEVAIIILTNQKNQNVFEIGDAITKSLDQIH